MQLILICKVHILVRYFLLNTFPIHAGDFWVLKKWEWKMKSCDFYEELWLLWNVATLMKSCDFYEKLQFLWKVVTFMKGDDFSERLWLFQRFVTFPVRHNKNHFSPPFVFYKLRNFLSFVKTRLLWTSSTTTNYSIQCVLYYRWVAHWNQHFGY